MLYQGKTQFIRPQVKISFTAHIAHHLTWKGTGEKMALQWTKMRIPSSRWNLESDRYSDPLQTSNTEPLIALVSLQKTPTMDHGDSRGWGVGGGPWRRGCEGGTTSTFLWWHMTCGQIVLCTLWFGLDCTHQHDLLICWCDLLTTPGAARSARLTDLHHEDGVSRPTLGGSAAGGQVWQRHLCLWSRLFHSAPPPEDHRRGSCRHC